MESLIRENIGKEPVKENAQDNTDVAHKDVRIYFDTNQFPSLPFRGPHPKPHG